MINVSFNMKIFKLYFKIEYPKLQYASLILQLENSWFSKSTQKQNLIITPCELVSQL
jgi:hypothetical protein